MCKPILLIGMMGCGKSTIGRLLAGRMGLPLIDLDEEIARAAGRSIPEIFAEEGDAGFRLHETAALGRALDAGEAVIATGGGIVTREENIRMMREKGVVVWLCRPLEDMIADVRQDTRLPNVLPRSRRGRRSPVRGPAVEDRQRGARSPLHRFYSLPCSRSASTVSGRPQRLMKPVALVWS